MLPAATTDETAMSRLWHARVCWALAGAGIDHLVIKGVATADLLGTERRSGDVDVLVAPPDVDRAVEALAPLGYADPLEGSVIGEGSPHSRTLRAEGTCEVDVHRHFPGVEADPTATWARLRERAERLRVAGHEVAVPDRVARALFLGLAAARDGRGSRAAGDFEAALGLMEAAGLRALAAELGALGPLRAGVWTLPESVHWEAALDLESVEVPDRWWLMAGGATGPERKLQELRDASWGQRVRILARELWPTRAFIAFLEPDAAVSRRVELAARWRRWVRLTREVPASGRKVRQRNR